FRARSTPLDDSRCRDLRPGDPLCVSCPLAGDELKFFDAVLESVSPAAHETVDGEERCACRFSVRWAGGPLEGGREEVGVERICCVRPTPVEDAVLSEFLDGVAKSLGGGGGAGEGTRRRDLGSSHYACAISIPLLCL
uniref:SAWADEE domain-containing protein n=1 Tax=Leersia perrieri TaxID=77586 RepID=A0A0D9WG08_9ORYZ